MCVCVCVFIVNSFIHKSSSCLEECLDCWGSIAMIRHGIKASQVAKPPPLSLKKSFIQGQLTHTHTHTHGKIFEQSNAMRPNLLIWYEYVFKPNPTTKKKGKMFLAWWIVCFKQGTHTHTHTPTIYRLTIKIWIARIECSMFTSLNSWFKRLKKKMFNPSKHRRTSNICMFQSPFSFFPL